MIALAWLIIGLVAVSTMTTVVRSLREETAVTAIAWILLTAYWSLPWAVGMVLR